MVPGCIQNPSQTHTGQLHLAYTTEIIINIVIVVSSKKGDRLKVERRKGPHVKSEMRSEAGLSPFSHISQIKPCAEQLVELHVLCRAVEM